MKLKVNFHLKILKLICGEITMSDAVKINLTIGRYLKQILGGTVQDSHIYALALMMTGLIRSKSANFDEIGRKSGQPSRAKFPSRVKLIHRFNKNKHVSYESHFLPFIEVVIASLGLTEFRLSIDSSKIGRNCLLLVIGLVYKKRVIPLVWLVYKGSKGHSGLDKQLELLNQVAALLPTDATVIITGDAEFDGTGVIEWLKAHPKWHYALRTAKNITVSLDPQTETQALADLAPAQGQETFLTGVRFTHHQVGPVNIAILWDEAEQEHFYLVTDADTLTQAQSWYRRRYRVETLFSDSKSRGFGLDKSGLRHPDRLARLLIAVFLAYIWMIFLGALVITDHHLGLIARTDRFTNSLFQLGRAYLDRILEEGWDIPVSLALPDPRSFVHLVLV
jgi:Transposase DDE domain